MIIKKFPNLLQTHDYDCGPTALQSILAYYGINEDLEKIIELSGTKSDGSPSEKGTYIEELKNTAEKYGLKTELKAMTMKDIEKYLNKKIPVIMLIQAWGEVKTSDWENLWSDGHYVVAIGYDRKKIYFEDPESVFRTYLYREELGKRWHDIRGEKKYINYGLAVYGKKPAYNPKRVIHAD